MVAYEVVMELAADKFPNSGRRARAEVLRELPSGLYTCRVSETLKGVSPPVGEYESLEEAKAAIIEFWQRCDAALVGSYPGWVEYSN